MKFEKRGQMYYSYSVAGGLPWSEREEPWIQFVVADFPDRLEDRRKEGHNKAEKQAPIIANRILYFANASPLFPALLKKSDDRCRVPQLKLLRCRIFHEKSDTKQGIHPTFFTVRSPTTTDIIAP